MKKIIIFASIVCIIALFVVGVSASWLEDKYDEISTREEFLAYLEEMNDMDLRGYCHYCEEEYPYILKYEKWTNKIHVIRHYCVNCGLDHLAGCYGEQHRLDNGKCIMCEEIFPTE